MRVDPLRRRGARVVGDEVSRSYRRLPFSCVEIPDTILPPSSAASGFIIAESSCSEVTSGGPACKDGDTADIPAVPLRVLWLPPASLLPHDSSPDKPLDLVRRLLLVRPDKRDRAAGGTASAKTREINVRTSVLRLARQARLALDLLPIGYQIAGVWLRTDLGDDKLEECVVHQPDQYSFTRSLANAVATANASRPHISLNPEKTAELCCCFLFVPSHSTTGSAVNGKSDPLKILGYYCFGSNVTTLGFHRLPVVVRQAEHLQRARPLTQNIVYSTCIPVQVELSYTPSETFMWSIQTSRQQLCAALAAELYGNFTAVLSPPLLASAVVSSAVMQPITPAQQGCDAASFMLRGKKCCQCMNQKGHAHCTCTIREKVTEESPCNPPENSTSRIHCGKASSVSSRCKHRDYQFHADSCVNTGESSALRSSVVLTSPSESVWEECCGDKNFSQASNSLPICCFQPLLVGDLVSRYRILLDVHPELTDEGTQQGVEFRVYPCGVSCNTDPNSLSYCKEPEILSTGLSRLGCPVILSVTSEFVAAVVAPVNASFEYLRKSLAADAAAVIARRIVDCLADACAAYTDQKKQLKHWHSPDKEQQSLSQTLASLEVRRFYMVRLVSALQKGKKQYDGVVTTLLLSDVSNPKETEDVAAQAAAERFEVILGIPPSAVVPHSCLKDGRETVALGLNSARNVALVNHEREHQRHQQESTTNVTKNFVLTTLGTQTSAAAAFWNILEGRARREKITRLGACGGKTSAYAQKNLSRILLCGCLVLLVIVLVARLLFPSTTQTNQLNVP